MNQPIGGPLLHLSFARVSGGLFHEGGVPRVPTNEERLRAYRPYMRSQFANADAVARHNRIDARRVA